MKEINEMMEVEKEESRYTYDEISELFRKSENLDVDFKNHVLAYFNGMAQAMYNVSIGRELFECDEPDLWEEGYLNVKALNDRYKNA